MSFEVRGFLTPDLKDWPKKVREAYPRRFATLDPLSDLVQRCLMEMCARKIDPDRHKESRIACALMARAAQQFQGGIINVERGMITNARTIMRAGFETSFFVAASLTVENFYEIAMSDHKFQQDKLLRMHVGAIKGEPGFGEAAARLENARRQSNADMKEFEAEAAGYARVAKLAGMEMVYDTYYRALSTDSAHTNLWALMDIFDRENGGIQIGAAVGDYKDTLNILIVLGVTLVEIANHVIASDAIEAALRPLHDAGVELMPTPNALS